MNILHGRGSRQHIQWMKFKRYKPWIASWGFESDSLDAIPHMWVVRNEDGRLQVPDHVSVSVSLHPSFQRLVLTAHRVVTLPWKGSDHYKAVGRKGRAGRKQLTKTNLIISIVTNNEIGIVYENRILHRMCLSDLKKLRKCGYAP